MQSVIYSVIPGEWRQGQSAVLCHIGNALNMAVVHVISGIKPYVLNFRAFHN